MKDLSLIWMEGNNYAILSLPFITYSIQPNWNIKNNQNNSEKPFIASFKSSISMFQSFDCEYKTTSEAKKGCEIHHKPKKFIRKSAAIKFCFIPISDHL